jgi:hypothetical protein
MLNVMSYLFTDSHGFSVIYCDLKDDIHIQVDNKFKVTLIQAWCGPEGE